MCDTCGFFLLAFAHVSAGAGTAALTYAQNVRSLFPRRATMNDPTTDKTDVYSPLDRRDEIGLGLRQVLLNLGLDEARFGQTLTLDEIADGINVTRDDVISTIASAFPVVDSSDSLELLRGAGSIGDVMDLIVACEEDGAGAGGEGPELSEEEKAAAEQAARDAGLLPQTDAGPITGGPTDGPETLPPPAAGETPTLPPAPTGPADGPAIPLPHGTAQGSDR